MANTQQKSGAGAGAANGLPQPIQDGLGATILGPHNVPLERENPDLLASPQTDAGTIPNLKFSFAAARNRLLTGGWSREVTVRELPVAKELAGVNMRLKPGGIRELHWHKEAEWAYMLAGRHCAAVDQPSHAGPGSNQGRWRPGAYRRLVQLPGGEHHRGGAGGD